MRDAVERFPRVGPIAYIQALWQTRDDRLARLIARRLLVFGILVLTYDIAIRLLYVSYNHFGVAIQPGGGTTLGSKLVFYSEVAFAYIGLLLTFLVIPIGGAVLAWRTTFGRDQSLRCLPFPASQAVVAFLAPVALLVILRQAISSSFLFYDVSAFASPDITIQEQLRALLYHIARDVLRVARLLFYTSAIMIRVLTLRPLAGHFGGRPWPALAIPILVFLIANEALGFPAMHLVARIQAPQIQSAFFMLYWLAQTVISFYLATFFWRRDFPIVEQHTFASGRA